MTRHCIHEVILYFKLSPLGQNSNLLPKVKTRDNNDLDKKTLDNVDQSTNLSSSIQ